MFVSARGERIGVGIVGLSAKRGWAAAAHLPALRSVPDFEVRACSASTAQTSREAAEKYEIPAPCPDAAELARRPEVDLVVVTVKVPRHREVVTAALDAGKTVLCEWPLGNGLTEAEDLANHAAERGRGGFVGLQARSAPTVRYVADLVRSKAIGEVLSTSMLGSGDRWGATIDPEGMYLLDNRNGATLLSIPFGHAVDALCACLGEFRYLSATTARRRSHTTRSDTGEPVPMTAEDQVAVTGTLQTGAVAAVHYRGGRTAGTNFHWEINGTHGDIVVRGSTGHLQYGRVEVLLATESSGTLVRQQIPAAYEAIPADAGGIDYTVAQAYARLADDLRTGAHATPTFADAVVRHRMIAAVQQAATTGQRQYLGDTWQERAS